MPLVVEDFSSPYNRNHAGKDKTEALPSAGCDVLGRGRFTFALRERFRETRSPRRQNLPRA